MIDGIVDRYAVVRIDDEHFAEQVARRVGSQLRLILPTVGGKQNVGKKALDRVARVSRPVLDIVADGWLKTGHELGARRAQLFDDFVPLVDVWLQCQKDNEANSAFIINNNYIYNDAY